MVNLVPWKRKKNQPTSRSNLFNSFDRFFDEPFLSAFYPFNRNEWWPRVDVSEGKSTITAEDKAKKTKNFRRTANPNLKQYLNKPYNLQTERRRAL